jgi:NADP-dependent 3-hydroxy acid dehydrogenase YdfG
LKDKVVVVTGASSGIGRATVWRFAEKGARLVITGRRRPLLEGLKKELQETYVRLMSSAISLSLLSQVIT